MSALSPPPPRQSLERTVSVWLTLGISKSLGGTLCLLHSIAISEPLRDTESVCALLYIQRLKKKSNFELLKIEF